jgi:hypothetical protein
VEYGPFPTKSVGELFEKVIGGLPALVCYLIQVNNFLGESLKYSTEDLKKIITEIHPIIESVSD